MDPVDISRWVTLLPTPGRQPRTTGTYLHSEDIVTLLYLAADQVEGGEDAVELLRIMADNISQEARARLAQARR